MISQIGGLMHRFVTERIDSLLTEAEARQSCLAPLNRADKSALQKYLRSDLVRSPHRSLYARTDTWSSLSPNDRALWMARGLHTLHPEWVFSFYTAAALQGLYVPNRLLNQIHVAHIGPTCQKSRGIIVHHCKKELEPAYVQGIPVTPLLETTIDCLFRLSLTEGLPIADSALRNLDISKRQFLDLIESSGQYGAFKASKIALHANPLSESGGESMARAVMIEEGFALPELQAPIPHPLYKGRTYRVDFLWRLSGQSDVAGEFDGMVKLEDEQMLKNHSVLQTLRQERNREAALTSTGLRVMRFTYDDVRLGLPLVTLMNHYGIPHVA